LFDSFQNEIIPIQDLFDMTAKPVRDLLYSKTRNQPNRLFESARQIDVKTETKPNPSESKSEMMKELMVLNQRGIEGSMESRRDNFTSDENNSLSIETRQPIAPKNDIENEKSTNPPRY